MDGNQPERRSINLTKDDNKSRVREAYPVYKDSNIDRNALERQEYRNAPQPYRQSSYQQPQTMYDDPMPARNNYSVPPVQPVNAQSPPAPYQNDDLGRYYDYGEPEPVRRQAPPVQQPAAPQPVIQQPTVQQSMKFCKFCGERIPADAVICTHCGRQVEALKSAGQAAVNNNINVAPQSYYSPSAFESISDKSKSTSILLACFGFLGFGGLHRFYAGKPVSGILYFLSGGLCGIGTLVDILKLASGTFTDGAGRMIKK